MWIRFLVCLFEQAWVKLIGSHWIKCTKSCELNLKYVQNTDDLLFVLLLNDDLNWRNVWLGALLAVCPLIAMVIISQNPSVILLLSLLFFTPLFACRCSLCVSRLNRLWSNWIRKRFCSQWHTRKINSNQSLGFKTSAWFPLSVFMASSSNPCCFYLVGLGQALACMLPWQPGVLLMCNGSPFSIPLNPAGYCTQTHSPWTWASPSCQMSLERI